MARRREIILGVLMVGLAVVLWMNLAGDRPGGAPSASRGITPGGADISSVRVHETAWALLTAPRPAYDPAGRNIFQFAAVPPPPPPKLTAAEEEAIRAARLRAEEERRRQEALRREQQQAQQQQQRQAQPPPPVQVDFTPPPPVKPKPPPIEYKFIGYIGPPQNKIAVLHDGEDLVFARMGEELDKGVRILEIGYESIKFGYTDPRFSEDSQTLPMSSSY